MSNDEEILELLPWYVNNTLEKKERQIVEDLLLRSTSARLKLAEIEAAYEELDCLAIPQDKEQRITEIRQEMVAEFERSFKKKTPAKTTKKNDKAGLFDWLSNWITPFPAVALAASVALFLWVLLPTTGLQSDVDDLYAQYDPQTATLEFAALSMPWQQQGLGFIKQAPSFAERAFGAGIMRGKSLLVNEKISLPKEFKPPENKSWSDTKWSPYYQFGRWSVLTWAVIENETSHHPWSLHENIARKLQKEFKQQSKTDPSASMAQRVIEKIIPKIKSLQKNSEKQLQFEAQLQRQLMLAIQQLGPKKLP